MANVQIEINGTTIVKERHQTNDATQTIDLEEACQDNATITTIGTPSTREIEERHETIDPLEIDQGTAIVALQSTTVQEPEVNHHIVPIDHHQIIDDQPHIQCSSTQVNTQVLYENLENNGQFHHHRPSTRVDLN